LRFEEAVMRMGFGNLSMLIIRAYGGWERIYRRLRQVVEKQQFILYFFLRLLISFYPCGRYPLFIQDILSNSNHHQHGSKCNSPLPFSSFLALPASMPSLFARQTRSPSPARLAALPLLLSSTLETRTARSWLRKTRLWT
jgi:hypothetical protein